MNHEHIWFLVGFAGQALLSMRFLVQWLRSERQGRSFVPIEFWYLSIAGSLTLLAYAVHRLDPVFVVGQLGGLIVYWRNLVLIMRQRRGASAAAGHASR